MREKQVNLKSPFFYAIGGVYLLQNILKNIYFLIWGTIMDIITFSLKHRGTEDNIW